MIILATAISITIQLVVFILCAQSGIDYQAGKQVCSLKKMQLAIILLLMAIALQIWIIS